MVDDAILLHSELLTPPGLLEHIRRQYEKRLHRVAKNSLAPISKSELLTLAENEAELAKIDSRRFEELVSELLKADGYEDVELIPRHNEPGPDIIAICHARSGGEQKFIVECKRWRDKVGIDVLRSMMYKVDTEYRATGGIIVTTSRFTAKAIEEYERFHRWRLTLVDGEHVQKWIHNHMDDLSTMPIEHLNLNDTAEGREILKILTCQPALQISKNSACQRCGGVMVCGYIDLGGVDFYDNYFHVCTDCLWHEHTEKWSSWGSDEPTGCPFCREHW